MEKKSYRKIGPREGVWKKEEELEEKNEKKKEKTEEEKEEEEEKEKELLEEMLEKKRLLCEEKSQKPFQLLLHETWGQIRTSSTAQLTPM